VEHQRHGEGSSDQQVESSGELYQNFARVLHRAISGVARAEKLSINLWVKLEMQMKRGASVHDVGVAYSATAATLLPRKQTKRLI
jgi:hypothetical protein